MGFASTQEALAKGPVVRALDQMSQGSNAQQRLTALRDALVSGIVYAVDPITKNTDYRRSDCPGLTDILKDHLLIYWSEMNPGGQLDRSRLEAVANYLNENWFGDKPQEFARFQTRAIYAMGLIKALDSSLRGGSGPLPIDSYWFIHDDRFELVTLESKWQVTLLIATPVPVGARYAMDRRGACDAWVTVATDGPVFLEVDPTQLKPAPGQGLTAGAPGIVGSGNPGTALAPRQGYRVCTYKISGGPGP
jgi:hypothetical protein